MPGAGQHGAEQAAVHVDAQQVYNLATRGPSPLDSAQALTLPAGSGLNMGTYLPEPGSSPAEALDMLRRWIAEPNTAATPRNV